MLIGYARVSTEDQNLDRQIDDLARAGVDLKNIYQEKITGTIKDRPELNKMISTLKAGDIITISDLTRLSRSTKDLITLSENINNRGAELISLKEKIDTTTTNVKAMFGMLGVMAQFERDIISERTKEGLARARKRESDTPRVNPNNMDSALKLYDSKEYSISEICDMCKISKNTLYNYIRIR